MRPGLGTEGKHQIGCLPQGRVVPVRSADGDHERTPAAIAQRREPAGKIFGGNAFAALVEQDQRRARGQMLPQPVSFLALSLDSVPGTAFRSFDKAGKFIKQFGKAGSGAGEFNVPHALAMDSRGRLFVADRGNNRIQIFDQEGQFVAEWKQFGRPSGLFIDKNDVLYVADSESDDARNPGGMKRGIRVGSARDGKVTALIPDPWTAEPRPATTSPEGIATDAAGNIIGVEVTETDVKLYVKK